MWGQLVPVAVPLKPAIPFHGGLKGSSVVSQNLNTPSLSKLQRPNIPSSQTQTLLSSSSSSSSVTVPSVQPFRAQRIRPSPELGLASLLFVLSMAFAALVSLAIFSIPTINALRKLATSMEKLSVVVSQEVPGTLLSLKLSGLEVSDLTKQLTSIRQMILQLAWGRIQSDSLMFIYYICLHVSVMPLRCKVSNFTPAWSQQYGLYIIVRFPQQCQPVYDLLSEDFSCVR